MRKAVLVALAAGYLVLLIANTCFFAAGPDSSGYLTQARMLAAGRTYEEIAPLRALGLDDSLAYVFTPFGFLPRGGARMVPNYPVGTSVHFALAGTLFGWTLAPFLVSPLAAMGCLLLTYAVARELQLPRGWSIAAAVLLAALPPFVLHALQPVSDVLAAFWALLTIWCCLRARERGGQALLPVLLVNACRRNRTGRSACPPFAFAAGAAFAIGVAVRPSNLVLALPLILALQLRPRLIARAAAAALPFGLALMAYHHALYGSPFTTGYGSFGQVMGWSTFGDCSTYHIAILATMLTLLVAPGGLLVVFVRRIDGWIRALLAAWFGSVFLFYSFYSFCAWWSSSRFLLPALPALLIAFLHLLRSVGELRPRVGRWVAAAIVLIVLATEVREIGRKHVLHIDKADVVYPETVRWTENQIPPDAIVLSGVLSGAFYYHANRITLRFDQLRPETSAIVLEASPKGAPWYAVVSEEEGGGTTLQRRVPGNWTPVGTLRDVTLWRLERS